MIERFRKWLRRWLGVPDLAAILNDHGRPLDADWDEWREDYLTEMAKMHATIRSQRVAIDALRSEISHCKRGLGLVYPGY